MYIHVNDAEDRGKNVLSVSRHLNRVTENTAKVHDQRMLSPKIFPLFCMDKTNFHSKIWKTRLIENSKLYNFFVI